MLRLLFPLALLLPLLAAAVAGAAPPLPGDLPPVPTGTHEQLVREAFTVRDGLPSDDIRALALLPDGTLLVSAGGTLARRAGGRWVASESPAGVIALAAITRDGAALAGTADGVWSLADGRWRREPGSPTDVVAFGAEPDGTPWALAAGDGPNAGVWRRAGGWTRVTDLDEAMGPVHALCPESLETVYVAADGGLFETMGKRKTWRSLEVHAEGLPSRVTRGIARLGPSHLAVTTDKGLTLTNRRRGWRTYTGADGLPILNLTHAATGPDGTLWLGSDDGLVRWSRARWTYLAGPRWLPDDRVTGIAPAADGSVWVGTRQGLAHLYARKLTLEQKAALYQKDLESRDRRHGYVTVMQLRAPGDFAGATQEISDNDGLWTAMYIGSQSFRYAVTRSPEARAQARRSMQALLRLERITGLSGFPARAISHVKEPGHEQRSRGEWHPSPVEKDWTWKGDTSSDEIDGYFFALQVYHDRVASDEEKEQIRATCKRVMDHILDHGYYLVDLDGKPTTWGVWAPERLNDDPKWWVERGLNSLEILSHLKVAQHIVGDPRYERAYRELIEKHHYAVNTILTKVTEPGEVNHSDDELAFLSFYPLLQLEQDPTLRALYVAAVKRNWDFVRPEANPLWNFMYGACTGDPCDVEAAVRSLREIPLDLVNWPARNSRRADLKLDPQPDRFEQRQLLSPLSWTERPLHKWNGNPYRLDGGNGLQEEDQTMWLLPYWLGRYHRLIE